MSRLLPAMLARPVVFNAAKVALVVGTCLNLINQGPTVWHGGEIEWGKLLLNFVVPYLVASYSGAKATMNPER